MPGPKVGELFKKTGKTTMETRMQSVYTIAYSERVTKVHTVNDLLTIV